MTDDGDETPGVPATPDGSSVHSSPGGGGHTRPSAADYRRLAAKAMERARREIARPWTSDPALRAQVDAMLALSPDERIRVIEDETAFFADLRPVDG